MKTYAEFINEAAEAELVQEASPFFTPPHRTGAPGSWLATGSLNGLNNGDHVKVHAPGTEHHGKTGRIIRQNGVDYGVEMHHRPGKAEWFNAGSLHKA